MAVGRRADGTVGSSGENQHEVRVTPSIRTGPTIVPREDFKMERRDTANARLEALRERSDAYKAVGEKVPDHLARLLKEAEAAGKKRETRKGESVSADIGVPQPPVRTSDPQVDENGFPRAAEPEGMTPLPDYATGDFDAVEPVEKYPDFANPHKKGDLIPEEARARETVPDHLKGKASKPEKAFEQVQKDREGEIEKAHAGEPLDLEKARNPVPDPHQSAVAGVEPKRSEEKSTPKKAAETKAASKEEPKGATQSNKPPASNKPSGSKK